MSTVNLMEYLIIESHNKLADILKKRINSWWIDFAKCLMKLKILNRFSILSKFKHNKISRLCQHCQMEKLYLHLS